MTVQELIDKLMEIEDKTILVFAGFGHDYYTDDITVSVNGTKNNPIVELS